MCVYRNRHTCVMWMVWWSRRKEEKKERKKERKKRAKNRSKERKESKKEIIGGKVNATFIVLLVYYVSVCWVCWCNGSLDLRSFEYQPCKHAQPLPMTRACRETRSTTGSELSLSSPCVYEATSLAHSLTLILLVTDCDCTYLPLVWLCSPITRSLTHLLQGTLC